MKILRHLLRNSLGTGVGILLLLSLPDSADAQEKIPQKWTHSGWGGGGYFQASVFHPVKEGVIYMSGDVDGVYKTEDSGKQWRLINNGLSGYEVYALAVDPKSPETVYAASTFGLSKSTDGGEHWTTSPNTGPKELGIFSKRFKSTRPIAVDPGNSSIVYAGTPLGKIYKSEDGAKTWVPIYELKTPGTVYSVAVNPQRSSQIFAATETAGIVLSDDSGKTWKELNTPKVAADVTVAASDGKFIYGAFLEQGLQKSIDGGKTWTKCNPEPNAKVVAVGVSPLDANKVYCISAGAWTGKFHASNDGGVTWTGTNLLKPDYTANPTSPDEIKQNGLIPMSRMISLSVCPKNPERLFLAGNWRSMLSEDGGKSWVERDRGADISCVSDLRFHQGKVYVTVMDEGLLVSANDGGTWEQLWPRAHSADLSGHAWQVSVTGEGDRTRIVTTQTPWDKKPKNNVVVVSEDGGKTYKMTEAGLPDYIPKVNVMWGQGYMRALAVDPKNPMIYYAGIDGDAEPGKMGGGVFKSVDGGYTWKQLPNQPASRRMFYGLAVDPTDSNRIYWGAVGEGGGLYRSDDAGNSWKHVFKQEGAVFNVAVDKNGTVYCPGKNLWKSEDHGETWKQISNFTSNRAICGLQVHPDNPQIIWITATSWGMTVDGGIYKTTDGGETWKDITGDIGFVKPIVLRFNPSTNELWAAGVGIFKTKQ